MTDPGAADTRRRWRFGPGLLVTAAFIGPGTVTTASRAGAEFGFALLWALVFAVVATIVLQEMAARLGLVARRDLATAIRESIDTMWLRRLSLGLVLVAIVLGNTAYQTGNLMGAALGIQILTGLSPGVGASILGLTIVAMLSVGSESRRLQSGLIAIVLAMSVAFLATAAVTKPAPTEIARGLVTLALPKGSLLTVLALIGTTVVPYNLFLHATTVQQRWPENTNLAEQLRAARLDTVIAITLGGLVTMAIVATAATAFHQRNIIPANAGELAMQLQPLLGTTGKYLFASGLTAAGVTSAVTAPLAAGYASAGTFAQSSPKIVKGTAIVVAAVGTLLAWSLGKSPQATIVAAQAANGLLLPLVAVFLLMVMNRRQLLGDHCNDWRLNLYGGAVVLVAFAISLKSLITLVW